MLKFKGFLMVLGLGCAVQSFAQQAAAPMAPREVTGVVESFSGNTLDIKPANGPAVWVTIPDGIKVKSELMKPGTMVSVEARWESNDFVATGSPKEAKEK